EHFLKNFPDSEYQPRAQETAALLFQILAEDREHARKAGPPLEQLGKKERIAELIFRLRDQNGHQWSQPGSCDVFMTADGKEDSPAHRLVRFGYDAVPQLIEALDDQRFTRSVGFHRDFYFSHHVLRVGDAALQVLEHIAHRSFYRRGHTNEAMVKDGKTATVKAAVRAWYAELQKKGEKRLLREAVECGDEQSYYQGERLLEKYPGEAAAALIKG